MGGVAGHLSHLYDNPDLTFGKMKKILSDASSGKLIGQEKTDGANIYLSYRDGQATYARNKSDLVALGRNIQDLINRDFAGGDKVKNTYVKAFNDYQKAIKSLPENVINKIFQNGTVFYNAEIQGPAFTNIINYDRNIITIHQTGTKKVDPETKEISSFNDPGTEKLLNKVIDSQEQGQNGENFQLKRDAIVKLKGLSDDKDLKIAKIKLDKLLSRAKLGDSSTIEDYLRSVITPFVEGKLPEISPKIQSAVVENILGNGKIVDKLPPETSKEIRTRISQVKKDSDRILTDAIFPIEEIVHEFSVELLKDLESVYILDNKKEVQRLKGELKNAIEAIKSSGNKDAMDILNKQLSKIKHLDNVNTAIEGIVFQYDGVTYKFTGNFAPINQILGLFRYGRGKNIPKMSELEEQDIKDNGGRVIAAVIGGFKPPHAGHYGIAKRLADNPKVDIVYVLISPIERNGHSVDNRITIDKNMSLKLWKLYTKNEPKIKVMISKEQSPVKAAYDLMEKLQPGDTYVLTQGEKDTEAGDTRFKKAQEWSDKNNLGVNVIIVSVPPIAGGISGTKMREIIASGNKEEFMKYIPQHLSPEEKEQAWNIVNRNHSVDEIIVNSINEIIRKKGNEWCVFSKSGNKNLGCSSSKAGAEKRLGQVEYFKSHNEGVEEDYQKDVISSYERRKKELITGGPESAGQAYPNKPPLKRGKSAPPGFGGAMEEQKVEEMSAMSGGAVEGAPGAFGKDEKEDENQKPAIITGEEPKMKKKEMTREEFYEEIQLRECIKRIIKNIKTQKKSQNEEENKLRSFIQSLIKETKVEDKTPHSSTGINVLEDLLKKIIPILEEGYKSLTTDDSQRTSFRSHIISAVQNTISPDKARNLAGSDKFLPIEEDEQINNEVSVQVGDADKPENDEKFIDIEDKPKEQTADEEEQAKVNSFSIEGEDTTGRNVALQSFDKIEQQILDAYNLLANEEDINLFYDYLIENLKLYMDKWEQELQVNLKEPASEVPQNKTEEPTSDLEEPAPIDNTESSDLEKL